MDGDALTLVKAEVERHLRPQVKLLHTANGGIDAGVLLGLGSAAEDDLDSRPSHHDDGGEHDHDDFMSFAVQLGEVDRPETLLERLAPAIAAHDILRIKGFAAVAGKAMRLAVQGVGGRVQHYYDREWRAEEFRATRLVVIGKAGLDEAAVRAALAG
jgi:cobalamin biosynthesis protein CobW